ncbi:MAG: DNA mismatch repair protein MutS, partial [Solirubrobacteraceae bacterium]
LNIIDFTKTHMGSRLLKYWLVFPLKIIDDILTRQAIVEFFFLTKNIKDNVSKELSFIQDMERILTKIITYKINPSQLKSFLEGLKSIQKIKEMLIYSENNELIEIANNIIDNNLLISYIENILSEDPPVQFHNGNVVKSGFSKELDELRDLKKNAKIFVENYKAKEIEKTGINSLKIDYNSVFGYYIEIRNTHKDKVPEHWIRKQTLVNAERYFTNELKEFEIQILSAEDKIIALEKNIFLSLLDNITAKTKIIQNNTKKIAEIDCLLSLAICGLENNFVKPEINNSLELIITEGRHPVIEKKIQNKEAYISNNTYLGSLDQQIIMLTGPNMAGKSALLRQTAIIVILAQMGGYIPANGAKIGLIDKIFTRVGASDNISNNESTFMVEMNETANILNNLSNRSLILLDEIGRGTSTYDGVSLAWAVAEYLHEHRTQAKTIFATHYHELNEMATQFKKIKNFNVSIKEFDGKILFLRKLVPGGVAHSFGIHVARMAGIPKKVIDRAEKILEKLEEKKVFNTNKIVSKINNAENKINLNLFNQNDSLLQDIKVDLKKIDINTLTPIEALFKLNEIKNKLFNG